MLGQVPPGCDSEVRSFALRATTQRLVHFSSRQIVQRELDNQPIQLAVENPPREPLPGHKLFFAILRARDKRNKFAELTCLDDEAIAVPRIRDGSE